MRTVSWLFFVALLTVSVSASAKEMKIGFVDMRVILDKSQLTQDARAELQKEMEGKQKEIQAEEAVLEKAREEFEKNKLIMTKAQVEAEKKKMQEKFDGYRQRVGEAQAWLQRRQLELGKKALMPVSNVIQEIAKERGLSAVFEKTESSLLYADETIDLTAEVIRRVDQR